MSIDAIVQTVIRNADGSGELQLVPRDNRVAPAGQRSLGFDRSPRDVTVLEGLEIWGGVNSILHGETEIADRIGYTMIKFTVPDFRDVPIKKRKSL